MTWQISFILALQNLPGLTGVMRFFSFLGTEEFYLLFMPAIYWCVDATLGARLAVMLVSSASLNALLKLAFHLPRPYWVDAQVKALSTEPAYGLPSGHAMNAVAIWGSLAAQLKKRWVWAAALGLIFLISLSRLYLGAHFPTDVLGGWVFGAVVVWALLKWEAPVRARLAQWSLGTQIGAVFVLSLIYLALVAGILTALGARPDPVGWGQTARAAVSPAVADNAYGPRNPEGAVTAAGLLFGLGAGLALTSRYARFDARGPWGKRAARFGLGIVGALVFWLGLKMVFPTEPFLLGMTLRYGRYALTGLWVFYLAPWVFVKTKLAERLPA
jgi:membrane-associated phospholipid phosphatase